MSEIDDHTAQIRVLLQHHETVAAQIAELTVSMRDADHDRREMRRELAANTSTTNEIHDLLAAAQGAFKVLGWIGVGARWAGAIAAGCTAVYVAGYMLTHGGQAPK